MTTSFTFDSYSHAHYSGRNSHLLVPGEHGPRTLIINRGNGAYAFRHVQLADTLELSVNGVDFGTATRTRGTQFKGQIAIEQIQEMLDNIVHPVIVKTVPVQDGAFISSGVLRVYHDSLGPAAEFSDVAAGDPVVKIGWRTGHHAGAEVVLRLGGVDYAAGQMAAERKSGYWVGESRMPREEYEKFYDSLPTQTYGFDYADERWNADGTDAERPYAANENTIRHYLESGLMNLAQVAAMFGVSEARLQQYCDEHDIWVFANSPGTEDTPGVQGVRNRIEGGEWTLQFAADYFGVTLEKMQEYCTRHGITAPSSGTAPAPPADVADPADA